MLHLLPQLVTGDLDLLNTVDDLNNYFASLREARTSLQKMESVKRNGQMLVLTRLVCGAPLQLLRPPGDTPLGLDGGSLSDWLSLLFEPSSPLGLVLRRLLLAFDQLPFEAVARLSAALQVRRWRCRA